MNLRATLLAITFVCLVISGQAQYWEVTSGPPSGTASILSNSKGQVFVGTASSAVYKSTDNGGTWERRDNGLDDGINFYTINQLKLGTNDQIFATEIGRGLFRSRDDGETWQKMDIGIVIASNAKLSLSTRVLPNGKTAVFVGYDGGANKLFFRLSEDDGETFVEIPRSNIPAQSTSIFDVFISPNSDKLFACVSYNMGLFRTTNRGVSWRRIENSDTPSGESDDLFQTFASDSKGRIYVGRNALPASTKSKNAVVLRSSTDGESWEYMTNGWDNRDITQNRITGIAMGHDSDVWALTEKTSGVFFSSDAGASWLNINTGLPGDGSGRGLAATPNNHVFVGQHGEAVYRHLNPNSVNEHPIEYGALKVYPNPASGSVNVTVDGSSELLTTDQLTIDLLTLTGERIIPQFTTRVAPGVHQLMLSVSEIPNGNYICVVKNASGTKTGRILVLH